MDDPVYEKDGVAETFMLPRTGPGYDEGSALPLEAVEAARERFYATLLPQLRYESSEERGDFFYGKLPPVDLAMLDKMVAPLLPLSKHELVVGHVDVAPDQLTDGMFTPEQTVLAHKASLGTGVLATVYCPAWKVCWMQHTLHMVLSSYAACSFLCLHAVRGGPNTDMEIRFLEEVRSSRGPLPPSSAPTLPSHQPLMPSSFLGSLDALPIIPRRRCRTSASRRTTSAASTRRTSSGAGRSRGPPLTRAPRSSPTRSTSTSGRRPTPSTKI